MRAHLIKFYDPSRDPTSFQQQNINITMAHVQRTSGKEKVCLFCRNKIQKGFYRLLIGEAARPLRQQITTVLGSEPITANFEKKGLSCYTCMTCFGKLHRLQKLDRELETRLKRLEDDRLLLVQCLTAGVRKNIHPCVATPVTTPPKSVRSGSGMKRSLVKTPTPKKMVKRQLLRTPDKTPRAILPAPAPAVQVVALPSLPNRLDAQTQTQGTLDTEAHYAASLDPPGTVRVRKESLIISTTSQSLQAKL